MFRMIVCFLCVFSGWTSSLPQNESVTRMTKGQLAREGQIPWHAHVSSGYPGSIGTCGGSIIGPKWILTAAHCIYEAASVVIITGSIDLHRGTVSPARQWFYHEQYIFPNPPNDVGVVELQNPLIFNKATQPVRLPQYETVGPNLQIRASGRGVTEFGDDTNMLLYIDMVTISNDECQWFYGYIITDGVFCTKSDPYVGKILCSGDSGAPVVTNPDTNPMQVGILSAGGRGGQCDIGSPNILTRVSVHRNWISAKTGI